MTDDQLRAAMIAALPGVHPWGDVVDRLLPVVRAYAAAQLRDAADDIAKHDSGLPATFVGRALHVHADRLEQP
jgi:hypothetical protein